MDTGSFGIGLGIGLALGVVIGITIIMVMKSTENASNAGVVYTYDDENRLKSMTPVNDKVQLVTLKAVK